MTDGRSARERAEEAALVRAILDAPEDNGARLVYADWLQQRGDPRGELIALQCYEGHPRAHEVEVATIDLMAGGEARWLGAWHREAAGTDWRYHRGFLHHLAVPIDVFVIIANLLLEQSELPAELIHLGSLELRAPNSGVALDPQITEVAAIAARLRLVRLSLRHAVSAGAAGVLARCSGLARVETLRVGNAAIESTALPALLGSPYLDHLRVLELPNASLVDAEAARLAAEPRLGQVRRLVLASRGLRLYNQLSNDGVGALIAASAQVLELLDLEGLPVTDVALDELARVRPPLVELTLRRTSITNLRALAALPTLERLRVDRTGVDDTAVDAILALPNLAALNLAHTAVTAAGAERLLHEAGPALRELTTTMRLPDVLAERLATRFTLHRWH